MAQNRKVLITEDEPSIKDLMSQLLQGEGYEVLHAGTGKDALEAMKRENPCMIFLDFKMPGGMNGYETAEALKTGEPPYRGKIVLVSGNFRQYEQMQNPEKYPRADEFFDGGYLDKPFKIAEFLEFVSRVDASPSQ